MKLSNKTRTRLVMLNLLFWVVGGAVALVLLAGPRGLMTTAIAPIGQELGGWPALLSAAAGFDRDPIPVVEIAVDRKAVGAAQLLPGRPSQASDSPWFPGRVRVDGAESSVWLQLVASGRDPQLESQVWRVRFETRSDARSATNSATVSEASHGPMTGEILLSPQRAGIHAREASIRETARALGLLAPAHGFATVRINEVPMGSYFWSQRDSDATLDELGYPRGGIVQPEHSSLATSAGIDRATTRHVAQRFQTPIAVSSGGAREEAAERQLQRLLELTDRASDDDFDQNVGQLLDIEKFLRWNALAWLLGTPAERSQPRLAWFLDPVTGLLEPIVQDWADDRNPIEQEPGDASRLVTRLLANSGHRTTRNQLLWKWVTKGQDDVVATAEDSLAKSLALLGRATISVSSLPRLADEARYARSTRESFRDRRSQIDAALQAAEVRIRRAVRDDDSAPTLSVELEPRGLAEIQLAELRLELDNPAAGHRDPAGGDTAATLRLFDPQGAERRLAHVEPRIVGSAVRIELSDFGVVATETAGDTWRLEMELPFLRNTEGDDSDHLAMVEFGFRNAVTGQSLPPARLFSPSGEQSGHRVAKAARPSDDTVPDHGLPVVVEADTWVLPAGSYRLASTLVVPPQFRLRLEPGVRLHLDAGVGIVTFRGLIAKGTALAPIEIGAADPKQPWGAVGVARAPEDSVLDYVSISGGSKLRHDGLEFDGQLSFNASDFSMDHGDIRGSAADGLAAKRSSFTIDRSYFADNSNDGVESEWSTGSVTDTHFVDNGDDGLDLADSQLTVTDCRFGAMSDKAISADIGSIVTVTHTQLDQSGIAIASKNGSRVDARETVFRNNRLGFAVYRDNPNFDGGLGTVVGGLFENNERDFSVEPGSELELVDISRSETSSYRTAWSVRGPTVLRVAGNQSSMLYNSIPSNGKKRY